MEVEEFDVPPMVRQGQLIEEIAGQLPDRVQGVWSQLWFKHRNLSKLSGGRIEFLRPDGTNGYSLPPRPVLPLLDELREVMYRPGSGTWFSAAWTLTKDDAGQVSVDVSFNFDEEPDWDPPIRAFNYAVDQEDFPRDEEHMPDWLRERIEQAQQSSE